jgi:hypothetical protein
MESYVNRVVAIPSRYGTKGCKCMPSTDIFSMENREFQSQNESTSKINYTAYFWTCPKMADFSTTATYISKGGVSVSAIQRNVSKDSCR